MLQQLADEIMIQARASGDLLKQGAQTMVHSVSTGSKFLWDSLSDSGKLVLHTVEHTGELVVDQVSGAVGVLRDGVLFVGGKAVEGSVMVKDGVVMVGETVVGSVVNTTRFLADSDYRENVGVPWLRGVLESNREILVFQMQENQKSMGIMYRMSVGEKVSETEMSEALGQVAKMARLVPALALFLAPGGSLLLPLLSKMLPWELVPDLRPPAKTAEVDLQVVVENGPEVPGANAAKESASVNVGSTQTAAAGMQGSGETKKEG
ncbi:MAG: hypothetical protein EP343_27285 [Deltaproteobacteria bacterium]|nr:MAG: hypothetical protein EP343_27285 [Deltaproteobacteria bacterium]